MGRIKLLLFDHQQDYVRGRVDELSELQNGRLETIVKGLAVNKQVNYQIEAYQTIVGYLEEKYEELGKFLKTDNSEPEVLTKLINQAILYLNDGKQSLEEYEYRNPSLVEDFPRIFTCDKNGK